MLEVVVAVLVMAIVLTAVGLELADQVTSVGASRNEEAAQGLLTKALAEVRAMPYQDVADGLSDADPTIDTSFVHKSGTTWVFEDPAEKLHGTGETVLHDTPGATKTPAPFFPHTETSTVNGVPFTVSAYPTRYETPPVGTPSHTAAAVTGVIRVTVVVSWNRAGHGIATTLVGQTLVYSAGADCLTGKANPFAAPCKPNFSASAAAGDGSITIAAGPGAPYPVQGMAFTSLDLLLGGSAAYSDLVQTSTVLGWAQATGAIVNGGDGGSQIAKLSTTASNDPASGDPAFQSKTLVQTASPLTAASTAPYADVLAVRPSAGDVGKTVSTAAARSTQGCDSLAGTALATALPCGSGSSTQKGTGPAGVTASLFAGATSLGPAVLAGVSAQTPAYPDRTYSARLAPGTATCAASATSGCVTTAAQESLGTVTLAGLPSSVAGPAGWSTSTGLVSLTGYSASSTSSSKSGTSGVHGSVGVSVPVKGAPAPELTYWTGSGYSTATLNGTGGALAIPQVTATYAAAGGPVTVTITASLFLASTSTDTGSTTACVSACDAGASAPSPLYGTITYEVTQGATVIADLEITPTLGAATTATAYQAAS